MLPASSRGVCCCPGAMAASYLLHQRAQQWTAQLLSRGSQIQHAMCNASMPELQSQPSPQSNEHSSHNQNCCSSHHHSNLPSDPSFIQQMAQGSLEKLGAHGDVHTRPQFFDDRILANVISQPSQRQTTPEQSPSSLGQENPSSPSTWSPNSAAPSGYMTGVTMLQTGQGFKKTFYKRKLPTPPATAFASPQGTKTTHPNMHVLHVTMGMEWTSYLAYALHFSSLRNTCQGKQKQSTYEIQLHGTAACHVIMQHWHALSGCAHVLCMGMAA